MLKNLHPPGGLYRYMAPYGLVRDHPWNGGKVYLLTKWERPEGIDKKSPLLNAFFLVNGTERCVDISFFKYLKRVA